LISVATDQTIRFWDTSTWTETQQLRGHTDEIWAIAISEAEQLITTGKDGSLLLWRMDEKRAADGYRCLSESLGDDDVQPLDHSRVLLLPPGQPPELLDLKRDSPSVPLPGIGSSTNVLGCFGTNILCYWNGTNQIIVGELRSAEFVQRGAIALDSGMRPTGFAYNPARRLLAWSEGTSSRSLYLVSLATPRRRIELTNDVSGLIPLRFSEDGNYLAAAKEPDILRTWNVKTGQIVRSINENFSEEQDGLAAERTCFAANGSVLVVALHYRMRQESGFYNLARPDLAPQRVPGGWWEQKLAVSPNGELVAASSNGRQVLLFDAAKGEWIGTFHGHLTTTAGIAFSPDGRRLISTEHGREAVRLWDVGTRQELLTLAGADPYLQKPRWSADGDVILAGAPWQVWSAPSWEEIAAAEAKDPPSSDFGGQGKTEIKKP
jgi:WD40 repeat protein